ncbi:MAG TPA: hypothetical protein VGQ39_10530 [Pyrinomonadaceae bacterium]|jgi:hypothetical protein|nr:hypothetical protein [Pyrinomonadaceae bacterium]
MTIERVALVLALASCLASNVGSYQGNGPQTRALTKRSGWNVRLLSNLKAKSRAPIATDDESLQGIYATILIVPEEGILLEETAYPVEIDSQKQRVHLSPMSAHSAVKYDVDGRIFCYVVSGPGVGISRISKSEKRVGALGCLSAFAYYDEDGDGRFETLLSLDSQASFTLHVPSWVNKWRR